jgi:D-glycero-D-manno-heptose 1,7-bisphosphate phosphatase
MKKAAVFLDRDGTLIEERHYLHKPEEVCLFAGAVESLARLRAAGFLLVLVTNQSGVGRGYFTMQDVERVHLKLEQDLGEAARLDAIYTAPEAPDLPSRGRKPSPQFLFDARDAFGVDLARSYIIGDKLIDLECGWNAGVKRSLLVRTGYGRQLAGALSPDLAARTVVVDDLPAAAQWILQDAGPGKA